ncbi:Thioesterase/thiol ester dehydrase-isomerase [Violaceomyces palustris]|uniref:Thioesterase/thiol ester dehydrase-isomerase n=1 Tax=Violaceomyces palustris TaxID=1673888 RepID=A0ACD0NW56_9BASI|nr:Thioesterase/thiol ester dehydrase-isomerase [Violaceomyces palustris]
MSSNKLLPHLHRSTAQFGSRHARSLSTRLVLPALSPRVPLPQSHPFSPSQQQRSLSTSPPTSSAGGRSLVGATLLFTAVGAFSYLLGSLYPPSVISLAFSPPAPPRLDRLSEEGKAHTRRIEEQLQNLEIVKRLSKASSKVGPGEEEEDLEIQPGSNPSTDGPRLSPDMVNHYVMSRPYAKYDEVKAQHSLTAGSLRGPGLIAVTPMVFAKTAKGAEVEGGKEGDCIIVVHLGRSLCGHDGVIHGGMIATICDEALARTAIYNLPSNICVTAKLEVNYRKPVKADQFLIFHSEAEFARGRKTAIKGRLTDVQGNLLVEANALFVEPKYASWLYDGKAIKQVIEGK